MARSTTALSTACSDLIQPRASSTSATSPGSTLPTSYCNVCLLLVSPVFCDAEGNADDPEEYSAFNIVTWGSILILHAAMSNFGGAVALRLFLGAFEAAVTPGFALFSMQIALSSTTEGKVH